MTALDASWLRHHPLPRCGDGGKDERGQVLICGGETSLAGGVLLAGEAALRSGAGKVMVAVAPAAATAVAVALPEARVCALPDPGDDDDHPVLQGLERCDSLLVGPGMIGDDRGLARAILGRAGDMPIVVDAGALAALDDRDAPGGPRILTPHAGEMARLLDRPRAEILADPLAAATEAAGRFRAVVVMKGAETHLVAPGLAVLRYAGGGPGLGTSGSGDVLAGLIAGLLARGAAPFEAAAWGVFLHGEAGARLGARIGPLGFLAREIAAEVPAIMASFG